MCHPHEQTQQGLNGKAQAFIHYHLPTYKHTENNPRNKELATLETFRRHSTLTCAYTHTLSVLLNTF